jgi:hypothetical protein
VLKNIYKALSITLIFLLSSYSSAGTTGDEGSTEIYKDIVIAGCGNEIKSSDLISFRLNGDRYLPTFAVSQATNVSLKIKNNKSILSSLDSLNIDYVTIGYNFKDDDTKVSGSISIKSNNVMSATIYYKATGTKRLFSLLNRAAENDALGSKLLLLYYYPKLQKEVYDSIKFEELVINIVNEGDIAERFKYFASRENKTKEEYEKDLGSKIQGMTTLTENEKLEIKKFIDEKNYLHLKLNPEAPMTLRELLNKSNIEPLSTWESIKSMGCL